MCRIAGFMRERKRLKNASKKALKMLDLVIFKTIFFSKIVLQEPHLKLKIKIQWGNFRS